MTCHEAAEDLCDEQVGVSPGKNKIKVTPFVRMHSVIHLCMFRFVFIQQACIWSVFMLMALLKHGTRHKLKLVL